ncbi:MAG: hypothetical protein AB1Y26_07620 [Cycloclasticus sp.]
MSYAKIVSEDIRRRVLEILESDPDFSHNEGIIQQALGFVGHNISSDKLRTELAWLNEQGLISTQDVSGVVIAKLTTRGEDIALNRGSAPGVARSRPQG